MIKSLVLALCLLNVGSAFSADYLRNIQYDEKHFHPLPKLDQGQLVANPKHSLGELMANSLIRYECVIKTEEGESFKLNSKKNSYQIGEKEYLAANVFSLQNGGFYGSIGVVDGSSIQAKEFIDISNELYKQLELVEVLGKTIESLQPRVRHEGQDYLLNCS